MNLTTNLTSILQRIRVAEQHYERPNQSVALLAVSKGHSIASIANLLQAGQYHFGENYVQEALSKISALSQKQLIWHFIGPIQSNKIRLLAQNFSWVHTVYRLKDAQKLSAFRPPHLGPLNICIQIKLDANPNKSGIPLTQVPVLLESIKNLPHLTLRGLMTLPPYSEDFQEQRTYFKLVHELFISLNEQGYSLDTLSMGMTSDLEAAIAEGATMVRIGTGIFGPREG